ncbi:MAG: discoidin domain-containing protein [Candidatus Omnitrophota bacterium]
MSKVNLLILLLIAGALVVSGCGVQQEGPSRAVAVIETVETVEGDPLMYLEVANAAASSFDQTPDWAPEPNPMAPVDGDMLTRWSSNYTEGDQWIYFDFGKERVVSNVIIRWERAHAAKYKILVSNDAKAWKEVYSEENGQGGAMEASFSPAKCRYLKILGTERVNDDWGISIWEVEIYGPRSYNPGAEATKKGYLGKGEEEGKSEEADNLLDKMASPVVPISEKEFQNGVVYTSWMADELAAPTSDFTLAYLKGLGFDTIAIMVPAYQEDIDSEVVFTNDKPGGDTPTDEALVHAIESCHKLGLRVMLKPHVDPRTDEARINIMPSEAWFDSFEKFTLRYARMAQENNVEIFSVGTELEATTFSAWSHRWNRIIDKVEEVYDGYLTYSANWTEYEEVPFWDRMDFIGIDAYFPLAGDNEPTLEDLRLAWEAQADKIEKWLNEKGLTGKGILLTEIGYPSANGAARQPWVAISNVEDQQEQADCLQATFDVLVKRPWFKGYYIWQYFPQDRWSPLGFTVKGKKAEEVLKDLLKQKK